jgi:rare lipoprotein A
MARRPFGSDCWRVVGLGALALGCLALANCTQTNKLSSRKDPRYGVAASPRVVEPGQPVPKGGGTYRVGKPYVVAGRTYVPEENGRYRAEGTASWYGEDFHGRLTANGEVYDMESISGAHATLPMPSYARVTNMENGRSLIVRVNDRGPYHPGRVIDLSSKAAELLEFRNQGTARVRVEYVGSAPLEGTDDRHLLATLREGTPAPAPSVVRVASGRSFVPQLSEADPLVRKAGEPAWERRYVPGARLPVEHSSQSERRFEFRDHPPPTVLAEQQGWRGTSAPTSDLAEAAPARTPIAPIGTSLPQPKAATVSAYAPVRRDGSADITTGRGLY